MFLLLVINALTLGRLSKTSSCAPLLADPQLSQAGFRPRLRLRLRTADPLPAPGATAQIAPEARGRPTGAELGTPVARLARLGWAHRRRRRGRGEEAGLGWRGGAARLSPPRTPLCPAASSVGNRSRRPGPCGSDGWADARLLRRCLRAGRSPRGCEGRSSAGGARSGAEAGRRR